MLSSVFLEYGHLDRIRKKRFQEWGKEGEGELILRKREYVTFTLVPRISPFQGRLRIDSQNKCPDNCVNKSTPRQFYADLLSHFYSSA